MFELIRFTRYALRFEKAFRTDDWTAVRRCFADDATYTIAGGGTWDGETHGSEAIMGVFQRMLNEFDRRFDRRIPKLVGWPRSRGGVVTLRWRARYVIGAESAVLTGVSVCRFEHGKIKALSDTSPVDEARAAIELCERACPSRPVAGRPAG